MICPWPFLFLIYINDICNVSSNEPPLLFADDTTLTYMDHDLNNLTRTVNNELSKFHIWLSANKLSLNITKTNYILFHNHTKQHNHEPITINNIPIHRASTVKLLGVDIDDRLPWKTHINTLQKKLASATFMLRKIRSKINTQTALLIYDSCFPCKLCYH